LRRYANSNEVYDAIGDAMLEELIKQYRIVSADITGLTTMKDSYKAQILERIGTASKIITSFGSVSCGEVSSSPGTLITPDLIGKTIGGREGYRNFRFYPKKQS
jgi:hypothetical protein